MDHILKQLNKVVWGVPSVILILGVGLYLSIRTGFAQIWLFPKALKDFGGRLLSRRKANGVSSYQAFCTALAATVGTGNLAGVAGAIAIGGPGAIFWMWICGFLGMITKYAEAVLAVRYRVRSCTGEWMAGPMYVMERGLGPRWRFMAGIYAFLGVVAAFGVGNATQINAVIGGFNSMLSYFGMEQSGRLNLIMGVIIALLIGAVILGGQSKIGKITEKLVPAAALFYLLICFGVLILCYDRIPGAFSSIIQGAFHPKAATGGLVGSFFLSLRTGTARGVFTNEAGMGTAGIAHGSAEVKDPAEQGLFGIMEVFLDTIVICTMTGLVILCSGIPIPYGLDEGILLTSRAFSSVYGSWITIPISLSVCTLAIATVLGWGLYGGRCAQYLFGEKVWKRFCILQVGTVILGAILGTGTVWLLAELVNGLMAIPNLIALAMLTGEVCRITREYKNRPKNGAVNRSVRRLDRLLSSKQQIRPSYSDRCSSSTAPVRK